MRKTNLLIGAVLLLLLHSATAQQPQPASDATRSANQSIIDELPFEDTNDFEMVKRGFIAALEDPVILGRGNKIVSNQSAYEFIQGTAPHTVNPSLWRQAKLNGVHGLFEVVDGIYQVRGVDVSNMTFIRGEKGWIVVDAMLTMEPAKAAMELVFKHLGKRPISAVIITHSHADHFGGLRALLNDDHDTQVIVPEGFLQHVGSEGIIAGSAMTRRAMYQFGVGLERSALGHVDTGLGKQISAGGTRSLAPPTLEVTTTGEHHVIDGVEFVFQMTPGAEAPAELMFYLPEFKALCAAEIINANMHNLYTLRGAMVRDGLLWSKHINDSIELFGEELEMVFGSHHWPRFGRDEALDYLAKQRDLYRYIHDQTVRLMSNGLTPKEIAEDLELPPSLGNEFFNRGYYGTLSHNAKAVYQHYLGWFDGVPANLNPHPPSEAGKRYVRLAGGPNQLLEHAQEAFAQGDYRWAAEVVNHLVFADPNNQEAKALLADTYEQLGYQAESGIWRDFYLTGALELRTGKIIAAPGGFVRPTLLPALPTELLLDYLAIRLDPTGLDTKKLSFNLSFTDRDERFLLFLENSVLHNMEDKVRGDANADLKLSRLALVNWASGEDSIANLVESGEIQITRGDSEAVFFLFEKLKPFNSGFPIVTP